MFIVRNIGFVNMIEPYDELMADRGCKIREDLMMHMATLCIPPIIYATFTRRFHRNIKQEMSESMWSKPLDGLKCFFFIKMNCQ